jgi:hypothetical protein
MCQPSRLQFVVTHLKKTYIYNHHDISMVNGRFGGIRACVTKLGRAAEEEGCWYTKIRPQPQMWSNVGEELHVR